jgi:Rrf2 family protein
MLSFSQTTGHSLLALACLDEASGNWTLARDVAEQCGMSEALVHKLLHHLARADVVETRRGSRGGFRLTPSARQMSLHEFLCIVEGDPWLPECIFGLAGGQAATCCPSTRFWTETRDRIETRFRQFTLEDALACHRKARERLAAAVGHGDGI